MSKLAICLAAVLVLGAVLAAGAADWPQWRGPDVNGIAPDTGLNKNWAQKPPKALWQVPMGDQGYAGPSVAGGKVFIVDHQGDQDVVKALDFATGAEVWRYAYADTAKPNNGFARCTPVVNEGKVYTIGRLGQVNCLDEATGKLVWTHNLLTEFGGKRIAWDYSMSVLIDGNKAILEPGGANLLVAVDKNTGQVLWQGGGSDDPGYATPVLATLNGLKQYVVFSAAAVRGISAEDGTPLWSYPWKTSYNVNAATPLIAGNQVFITSGYGAGCAMLQITGEAAPQQAQLRWMNKEMQGKFSSSIAYQGYLWGGGEGKFVGLDPANGNAIFRLEGYEQGSLLGVEGVLLVLMGGNGEMLMMTAANPPQPLGWFTPLGGQSWTAPIMVDGKMIVRNTRTLACFDMK